ncbi:MAG: RsbRD N-terminal domain-containing protein [Desulfobacterales bacterium]|nr:RsbRD N-terminal domain-containing protein [Desulfobacterales bacterium]
MSLDTLLDEKRADLGAKWIKLVLATYGAPEFLNSQQNRFANPIGYTVTAGIGKILQVLVSGSDLATAAAPLEEIIKIRAVQDFSPSDAVSFVFGLKQIVRHELRKELRDATVPADLAGFEARVDSLALMAFDLYMASRERLFQVRLNELKSGNHVLTDDMVCPSAFLRQERKGSAAKHK